MQYLTYQSRSEITATVEKQFDNAAHKVGRTLRICAKFLAVILGYILFNIFVAIFFKDSANLFFDKIRSCYSDSFRYVSTQDIAAYVLFFQTSKFNYSMVLAFVFASGLFLLVNFLCDKTVKSKQTVNTERDSNDQRDVVVLRAAISYKHHVAFLA